MDMTMTQKLEKGLSASATTTVTAANTALVMGSGDLEVFATPSMVALMEHAAMTAVAPALPEGSTTVGAEMNTTHIKPSGLGASVTATAILTEVDGRKLTFNVGARDAEGLIGEGVHVRYVVDRARFMAKLSTHLGGGSGAERGFSGGVSSREIPLFVFFRVRMT